MSTTWSLQLLPAGWSRRIIWATSIICSILLVVFAFNMYPVPDGDSIFFLPAIKSFASSGILENKLVDISFQTDIQGAGRFLFYTPGFPLTIGSILSLAGLADYRSILVLLSIARVANLLIFAKAVILAMQSGNQLASPFYVFLSAGLIASNGLFLFASNGRPEILSILIVSIALLAAISLRAPFYRHLVLQLCISFVFTVSIANGVIAFIFYFFYLVFDIRSSRKRAILSAILTLLILAFFMASYFAARLPLVDGLSGLSLHARMQLNRGDTGIGLIFSYWKSWMLFGILAATRLLNISSSHLRNIKSSTVDGVWLAFGFALLIYGVYFFGLRAAPVHYNLYAFLSLYQFLALQLFIASHGKGIKSVHFIISATMIAGIVLALIDPARSAVLFPYYLTSGSTYSEMKPEFSRLSTKCSVVYTNGVAMLDESQRGSQYKTDDSSRIVLSERIKHSVDKPKCILAFVQEVNSNSKQPAGASKVVDLSDKSRFTNLLRSLKLVNSPKGYSFRAYRQESMVHNP